jgi:hypothetical protein
LTKPQQRLIARRPHTRGVDLYRLAVIPAKRAGFAGLAQSRDPANDGANE